jgi:hypothetical protein
MVDDNNVIVGNNADGAGAGLHVSGGATSPGPTITNCEFTDNSAVRAGGGILVEGTVVTMTNCLVARNQVLGMLFGGDTIEGRGGGIHVAGGTLNGFNLTIVCNTATVGCDRPADPVCGRGGGVYVADAGAIELRNSIPWCNHDADSATACIEECEGCTEAAQVWTSSGSVGIDYSIVQDLTGAYGTGNLDDDPLLAAPLTNPANYRVRSASPAIDAGDDDASGTLMPADGFDVDDDEDTDEPTPDLDHGTRVREAKIDMGAYEHVDACVGDVSDDQIIGFADLIVLLAEWGSCGSCLPYLGADLNQDCEVGFGDLLIMLSSWGPCGMSQPLSPPESVYECMEKTSDPAEQAACIEAILLTQGE